jgi:ATP phosphoribosyltransferase
MQKLSASRRERTNQLRLLLPKGSLNTPGRGDTCGMMKKAKYDILGYEPGKETEPIRIANDSDIRVMLSRPQSAPTELILGMADAAIVGSDWVNETQGLKGKQIIEILDLEYGKAELVFASSKKYRSLNAFVAAMDKTNKDIVCFSEYVNTTAAFLASCGAYKRIFGSRQPMKEIRGTVLGRNSKAKVVMSDGVTEGYIAKGANLVMDNSQSGSTMARYGLEVIEEIGTSSARLYARAGALADSWLKGKIDELSRQLASVVEGSRKYYVVLNVPSDRIDKVVEYARLNGLFADEPTIVSGKKFCQISLLVPKANWPKISQGLVERGARNIIPLEPGYVLEGLPNI